MPDLNKMEEVFVEVADRLFSAEQTRNFHIAGFFKEDQKIAKNNTAQLKTRFATAKAANDMPGMQSLFDEAIGKFESSDHVRNFVASREYKEAERSSKGIVKSMKARFAAASV